MRSMFYRAFRAAMLDRGVYRDLSKEPDTVLYALGTVVLVGIAYSLGLSQAFVDPAGESFDLGMVGERVLQVWASIVVMLFGWVIWAGFTYMMASKILGGGGDFRPTLRALGIAYGPGVLFALSPMPYLGIPISLVGLMWMFVTGVVAVHETQGVDWFGAVLSAILGWFLSLFVLPLLILSPMFAPQ